MAEAALHLRQVGDTSVPVILNIIGNDTAADQVLFPVLSPLSFQRAFFSVCGQRFYFPFYPTGLESAKSENYEEAFTCFLVAAQHGYDKAQFNTAVCYEKGRGVGKDKEKVRRHSFLTLHLVKMWF